MAGVRAMLSSIVRRFTERREELVCLPKRLIVDPTPRRMDLGPLSPGEREEAERLFTKMTDRTSHPTGLDEVERGRWLELHSRIRHVAEPGYEDSGFVMYLPAENAALMSADALAVMLRQGGMRCAAEKNADGDVDIVLEADRTALLLEVEEGFVASIVVDVTFVDEGAKSPRVCELLESLGWVREE